MRAASAPPLDDRTRGVPPVSAGPSYRRSFGLNFAGNVGYAAAQYALLVVLARLGSPVIVGQYSLALALAAPVFMFTNVRLAVLLATDAGRSHAFGEYLSARVAATALAAGVVVSTAAAAGYRGPVLATAALVAASKAAESVSDICYGYLALRESFGRQCASMLVRGFGAVGIAFVAAVTTHSLGWIAAGIAGVWLAALVLLDLPSVAALAPTDPMPDRAPATSIRTLLASIRVDGRAWRLLRGSLPLGLLALAISLNVSVPRVIIERQLGARALGYFSALAYLVVGGRMVALALGASAVPRLGRYHVQGNRTAFVRTLFGLVGFGAGLGAVGVLGAVFLGRPVLRLLYGTDYAQHAPLLVWFMVAAGLGYMATYLQDSLTTMRSLVPKAVLSVGVVATSGLLSLWLVPRFGLGGAAVAVCAAAAVELVGSAVLVWVVLRRLDHAPAVARGATVVAPIAVPDSVVAVEAAV